MLAMVWKLLQCAGTPSFEVCLVLSKMGEVAEGEEKSQLYLIFSDTAGKSGVAFKGRDLVGQSLH